MIYMKVIKCMRLSFQSTFFLCLFVSWKNADLNTDKNVPKMTYIFSKAICSLWAFACLLS